MNQTSLVGRPLYQMSKSIAKYLETRTSGWSGPLTSSSPELARLWGAPSTSTGMGVNETTAYTYSVFWACVNNISTDIGSFPLKLYKRESDGGKTLLVDHKLSPILDDFPNSEMTAFTFRGLLTSNALTSGMGYAEIVRDGMGRVSSLWPITPDRVQPKRHTYPPYSVYYEVSREGGTIDRLTRDEMFVLPGSTVDGVYGRNIVSAARESIGLGLAAERFGGTFYGNGSTFGGVFEHPTRMSQEAQKNFRESVNASHQGVDKAHKFIVAEEGMKFQRLTVDQNAAQFIETRQHQIEEMCRWFRMPPHKVQHLIRTSYNSVEQMNIEYSTDTLTPWCVRWEQEIKRQLIAPSERRIQFVKHNMDSKLRGDTAARYEAYTKGIQNGFLSADDVREKEDMNPLPNGAGKKYFLQSNTQPLDRVDEIIDKQVAPDPKPVAPAPAPKADDDSDRALAIAAEIRQQLAEAEARIAETAAKITTVEMDNLSLLRAQVEAAHAEAEAVRASGAEEAARLKTAVEEASARSVALTAEQIRLQAEKQQAVDAAQALVRALDTEKASTADAKAAAALDLERLQAELNAMTARASQIEADHQVMHQTVVAADLALTKLQADLVAAEALYTETSTMLEAERGALEAARAQVAQLQAAIAEAEAEQVALESDRVARMAEAATSAAKAEEAHREKVEATEKLKQATAEADAARERLEAETVRVAEERSNHEHTKALLKARADAEAARLQNEREANRELILRAVGRLVYQKEIEKAKRNSGTATKLLAWADSTYLLLEETWVDDLRPVMRAHLARINSTQDVDDYTRALVHAHLETAAGQLRAVAKGDPEDVPVSLERLFARWEQERPASLAAILAKEEVAYVRSL